jgi:hypothetical protein
MPDLRPCPSASPNGEPLASLEFGIPHTESATIDGDDSIEEGIHADSASEEIGRFGADSDEPVGGVV